LDGQRSGETVLGLEQLWQGAIYLRTFDHGPRPEIDDTGREAQLVTQTLDGAVDEKRRPHLTVSLERGDVVREICQRERAAAVGGLTRRPRGHGQPATKQIGRHALGDTVADPRIRRITADVDKG